MNKQLKPASLLLVEDDDTTASEVQQALARFKIGNQVHRARSVEEALAMLIPADGLPVCPKPYVVLLGLSLSGTPGVELLRKLRQEPGHEDSIVVVMTEWDDLPDRDQAETLKANGFVERAQCSKDLVDLFEAVSAHWQVVVQSD